jgi:hypothetical protein
MADGTIATQTKHRRLGRQRLDTDGGDHHEAEPRRRHGDDEEHGGEATRRAPARRRARASPRSRCGRPDEAIAQKRSSNPLPSSSMTIPANPRTGPPRRTSTKTSPRRRVERDQ